MKRWNDRRKTIAAVGLIAVLWLSGCGRGTPQATPTATPVPTATPAPTATPVPTATPAPEPADAGTTDSAPTPQVTIPQGFEVTTDAVRGYSLALPDGWTTLDLRSANFQRMAGAVGLDDQLAPLNEFLDSPDGDSIGLVAAADLSGMLFGGLPTVLNVSVVDAEGASPESVKRLVEETIRANSAMVGDVSILSLDAATINNLPAVQAIALVDLSAAGMDAQFFAKVTGLIANDKVYVLTLATEAGNRSKKEAEFDQIIGSFQPE